MALTEKGLSTTKTPGQFATETYRSISGKLMIQWDYRDSKGQLHSGIAKTMDEAIASASKKSGEVVDKSRA